jgi:hypothetical protein
VTRIQPTEPLEPLENCSPSVPFTSKRMIAGKHMVDVLAEPANDLEPFTAAQLREYLPALPPDDWVVHRIEA